MKNQEKVILQEKAELVLKEGIMRLKSGLAFTTYTILKDRHHDNIGQKKCI